MIVSPVISEGTQIPRQTRLKQLLRIVIRSMAAGAYTASEASRIRSLEGGTADMLKFEGRRA